MMRKIVHSIFALLLCFSLLPTNTIVHANTAVSYLDAQGTTQTIEDYTIINNTTTSLTSSDDSKEWYVVNENIEINTRLQVSGDVHLILLNNSKLIVNGGIHVSENNQLTIYSQTLDKETMGKLYAIAESGAGIGGNHEESNGKIEINGGYIVAYGGVYYSKDNITGNIGIGGAGIGSGGTKASTQSITINNGYVEAYGGYCGSDEYNNQDNYGGGAGIGGDGQSSAATNIAINGGEIHAQGGCNGAAGIGGGGHDGKLKNIQINGGLIYAQGSYPFDDSSNDGKANAIGDGANYDSFDRSNFKNAIIIDETNQTISIHGNGQGIITLPFDFEVPEGYTFDIYGTLNIPEDLTFINNGTIDHTYGGNINGNWTNNGTIQHVLTTATSTDASTHTGVCLCGETVTLSHNYETRLSDTGFEKHCAICNHTQSINLGSITYDPTANTLTLPVTNSDKVSAPIQYQWQQFETKTFDTTPGEYNETASDHVNTVVYDYTNVEEDGAVALQLSSYTTDTYSTHINLTLLNIDDPSRPEWIDSKSYSDDQLEEGQTFIFDHLAAGNYQIKIDWIGIDSAKWSAESVETTSSKWVNLPQAESRIYTLDSYQEGDQYKVIATLDQLSIERTIQLSPLQEISGVIAQDALYDGKTHLGYTGQPTINGQSPDSIQIDYYQLVDDRYQKIDSAPISVGEYQVVFSYQSEDGSIIARTQLNFSISYDGELQEDGTLIKTETDQDGNTIISHTKVDGTLLDKTTIANDGTSVKEEYPGDGTTIVTTKDKEGNILSIITYFADGSYIKEGYTPSLIKGNQSVYDGKHSLVFYSDDELINFLSVEINGKTLSKENYEVASGSIRITLQKEYLDTLTPGQYQISICSTNGKATGTFTILDQSQITSPEINDSATVTDETDTGIRSDIGLYVSASALAAFFILYLIQKKKQHSH